MSNSPALPSRPYNSTLRKKQAAATRELILTALASQLVEEGLQDFSIDEAAARAGVSPRTIYRYFPNREALLEALGAWIDAQLSDLIHPTTPAQIAEMVETAFPRFDQQSTLVEALLMTELGKNVRSRRRTKRREAIATALEPLLRPLEPEQAHHICAVIQHLSSASVWKALKDEAGMDGTASGKAIAWALRTLMDAVESMTDPADASSKPQN